MLTFNEPTHTYQWDGKHVPSVTQAIFNAGLVDDRWFDDYSRDRGTAVHRATELFDLGTLDESTLDPVLVPYLSAYKLFLLETGAEWDAIEERVFNKVYRYSGTLDRRGTINGRNVIVDLKTGQPNKTTALQIAAYAAALGLVCDRLAVHLKGDGKYSITSYNMADQARDFAVFHACLTVANWKENNK